MKSRRILLVILAAMLLLSTGCSLWVRDDARYFAQPVATVGKNNIILSDYQKELITYIQTSGINYTAQPGTPEYDQKVAEAKKTVMDNMVRRLMIKDLATQYKVWGLNGKADQVEADKRVAKGLAEYKDSLRQQYQSQVDGQINVAEKVAADWKIWLSTNEKKEKDKLNKYWVDKAKLDKTIKDPAAKAQADWIKLRDAKEIEMKKINTDKWTKEKAKEKKIDVVKDTEKDYQKYLKDNEEGIKQYRARTLLDVQYEGAEKRLKAKLMENFQVTEQMAQEKYNSLLKEQQKSFGTSGSSYESAMNSYWKDGSSVICFAPKDYKRVKHILVSISEDKQKEITDLRGDGKDKAKAKKADDLQKAELAKIMPKVNEILGKIKAGEDFDKLLEKYGEDPGEKTEPSKTHGYLVGPSTTFVDSFKKATVALKKVGDVSPPTASNFGYHFIKLYEIVKPGALPMKDIKGEIENLIKAENGVKVFEKAIEDFKKKNKISYKWDVIDANTKTTQE